MASGREAAGLAPPPGSTDEAHDSTEFWKPLSTSCAGSSHVNVVKVTDSGPTLTEPRGGSGPSACQSGAFASDSYALVIPELSTWPEPNAIIQICRTSATA